MALLDSKPEAEQVMIFRALPVCMICIVYSGSAIADEFHEIAKAYGDPAAAEAIGRLEQTQDLKGADAAAEKVLQARFPDYFAKGLGRECSGFRYRSLCERDAIRVAEGKLRDDTVGSIGERIK